MWRVAERITAPTLVITGRQDRLVDARPATVVKVIPDSRLLVLDGVGHVAQMECPRIVARAVAAMLDEVKATTATATAIPTATAPPWTGTSPIMSQGRGQRLGDRGYFSPAGFNGTPRSVGVG